MISASARLLTQAGRPHLRAAWRQRTPLLAAARTWSAAASSSGTPKAGLFSNQRHRGEIVRFTGLVGRGSVAAPGDRGRATKLMRSVFVQANTTQGKNSEGGGGGGEGGGSGKGINESGGAVVEDSDEDEDEDEDDEDDVFDDEDGVFDEEDELMQTDENGELISTGDEDIDVDEAIFTAGTEWGELALKSLEGVLKDDDFESSLEIFSFKVSTERRRIYVSVDNVKDKFGSPTLDQLSSVSKKFNAVLEEAGFPDDVALEVASPGAERRLRLPGDLKRFRDLTMRVTYNDVESQTTACTVMLLTDVDEEKGVSTWKLADVAENRPQAKKGQGMNKKQKEWRLKLAFKDIAKANLFVDI